MFSFGRHFVSAAYHCLSYQLPWPSNPLLSLWFLLPFICSDDMRATIPSADVTKLGLVEVSLKFYPLSATLLQGRNEISGTFCMYLWIHSTYRHRHTHYIHTSSSYCTHLLHKWMSFELQQGSNLCSLFSLKHWYDKTSLQNRWYQENAGN